MWICFSKILKVCFPQYYNSIIDERVCSQTTLTRFWLFWPPTRGYREVLDGRLCRPDSEQRPLVSNFSTMAIVKLCCHNFTQIANLMIFFVSTISYRPTDLSLLKEFSKNVSFSNSYKLPSQSAFQKLSMSMN